MNLAAESPVFDVSDLTALVCVDQVQYQKMIVAQLSDLGYKVHLGLFEEDVLLKLATYSYNVVVVYENFKSTSLEQNPILRELVKRPGSLRRDHFVILLTHGGATNDATLAFSLSVDQVINVADIGSFKPVLRRGIVAARRSFSTISRGARDLSGVLIEDARGRAIFGKVSCSRMRPHDNFCVHRHEARSMGSIYLGFGQASGNRSSSSAALSLRRGEPA